MTIYQPSKTVFLRGLAKIPKPVSHHFFVPPVPNFCMVGRGLGIIDVSINGSYFMFVCLCYQLNDSQ